MRNGARASRTTNSGSARHFSPGRTFDIDCEANGSFGKTFWKLGGASHDSSATRLRRIRRA
jgi:hypothetical protein